MNTNEKIAKWLGWISEMEINQGVVCIADKDIKNAIEVELDFLHDRNQQKWIKDKLKELKYMWVADFNGIRYSFIILERTSMTRCEIVRNENKDEDLAFIQAVEQLINKG
jgi:hypothetical protein